MTEQDKADHSKDYGCVAYWYHRYAKTLGQRYDWLYSYASLQGQIDYLLHGDKSANILNIGCGNGEIQDHLYECGYHHITNNDISEVIIKEMYRIRKYKHYDGMVYEVMDVRKMGYQDEQFNMVLDKSTIDTLMCSYHPVIDVASMLQEIYRVLKPNGIYFAVSYGAPWSRLAHLKREHVDFAIEVQELKNYSEEGELSIHYLYVCRKGKMEKKDELWLQQYYYHLRKVYEEEYS